MVRHQSRKLGLRKGLRGSSPLPSAEYTTMNFLSQNGFFILGAIATLGFGIIGWLLFDTRRKVRSIFGETDGSATGLQQELLRRLTRAEAKLEEMEPRLETTEAISKTSVRKVGFARFNPFSDTGGDNSFVIALLDSDNNGIIVSSLYMREGARLYAKRIERGEARQQLSQEEERVLAEAMREKS